MNNLQILPMIFSSYADFSVIHESFVLIFIPGLLPPTH